MAFHHLLERGRLAGEVALALVLLLEELSRQVVDKLSNKIKKLKPQNTIDMPNCQHRQPPDKMAALHSQIGKVYITGPKNDCLWPTASN